MSHTEISKLPLLGSLGVESVPLKRFPPGKARLDVVPPFDLIAFVGFPAEQDYPAITHRGKINQTLMVVFQLDAEAFQLPR